MQMPQVSSGTSHFQIATGVQAAPFATKNQKTNAAFKQTVATLMRADLPASCTVLHLMVTLAVDSDAIGAS
jgi:hypothetical protein